MLHHFSNEENRVWALRELQRVVRVGGQVVMTVWAFEQEKKKYDTQDVMIPWHLKPQFQHAPKLSKDSGERKKRKKPTKVSTGTDEEPAATKEQTETTAASAALAAPPPLPTAEQIAPQPASSSAQPASLRELSEGTFEVYERYYHLFRKGELEELILRVPGFEIVSSTWDADNWYVVARRTQ